MAGTRKQRIRRKQRSGWPRVTYAAGHIGRAAKMPPRKEEPEERPDFMRTLRPSPRRTLAGTTTGRRTSTTTSTGASDDDDESWWRLR